MLPWDRSRLQRGKFKLGINNKKVSGSKMNIALEETLLSHLEILKERLDKKKICQDQFGVGKWIGCLPKISPSLSFSEHKFISQSGKAREQLNLEAEFLPNDSHWIKGIPRIGTRRGLFPWQRVRVCAREGAFWKAQLSQVHVQQDPPRAGSALSEPL